MIVVVSALTMLFMIMLLPTRHLVAALVIGRHRGQLNCRILKAVCTGMAGPRRRKIH
nr:hypothetical protein [Mycobacterium lepromatosis]